MASAKKQQLRIRVTERRRLHRLRCLRRRFIARLSREYMRASWLDGP